MKKFLLVVLILCLIPAFIFAEGEDNHFKLNQKLEIRRVATFEPTSFEYKDRLGYYEEGSHSSDWGGAWVNNYMNSGTEAEYALLKVDILNKAFEDVDFLQGCKVRAIYDDAYVIPGWCYQYNHNNGTFYDGPDEYKQNVNWVINEKDNFAIQPMYAGHYVFGATVPNGIVEDNAPFRLEIKILDQTYVFDVRK